MNDNIDNLSSIYSAFSNKDSASSILIIHSFILNSPLYKKHPYLFKHHSELSSFKFPSPILELHVSRFLPTFLDNLKYIVTLNGSYLCHKWEFIIHNFPSYSPSSFISVINNFSSSLDSFILNPYFSYFLLNNISIFFRPPHIYIYIYFQSNILLIKKK